MLIRGFDFYDPLAGTVVNINGVLYPFEGVPLGFFDFGSLGVYDTGNADTIIERVHDASGPGTILIAVRMLAMQMVSSTPIDVGAGLDLHYLTLQPTPSRGVLEVTEDPTSHGPPPPFHGVANHDPLNWRFDVRKGSLTGPVVLSDSKVLTSAATLWSHFSPPGALLIDGLNFRLNGVDEQSDIFLEPFALSNADGTTILMSTALPEPASFTLVGAGLIGLAARCRRWRRHC
jgi:hypothetical protein